MPRMFGDQRRSGSLQGSPGDSIHLLIGQRLSRKRDCRAKRRCRSGQQLLHPEPFLRFRGSSPRGKWVASQIDCSPRLLGERADLFIDNVRGWPSERHLSSPTQYSSGPHSSQTAPVSTGFDRGLFLPIAWSGRAGAIITELDVWCGADLLGPTTERQNRGIRVEFDLDKDQLAPSGFVAA
jgi:hypothetical protein